MKFRSSSVCYTAEQEHPSFSSARSLETGDRKEMTSNLAKAGEKRSVVEHRARTRSGLIHVDYPEPRWNARIWVANPKQRVLTRTEYMA